jgi:signal transduction histidine kinase
VGHAARELDRLAASLAATVPGVIGVGAGLLALTVVPDERRPVAALAVGLLALWRAGFALAARRGRAAALVPVDVAVLGALALAQRRVDAPYLVADSTGWVQAAVLAAVVGYPWLVPRARRALVAAAVLAGCLGAGAVLTAGPGPTAVLLPAAWVFGDGVVAVGACALLRLGARRADDATARRERARADLDVAAARRAAEREHLAALHDTAAATLLVVGAGALADDHRRVAEQAARDLAVLSRSAGPAPASCRTGAGGSDVVPLLRDAAHRSGLDVRLTGDDHPVRLPAHAAAALADAAGEALRNVRRHAGVERATVTLRRAGDAVRVEVADAGRGLPPGPPDPHARGVRDSIVGRLAGAGGRAEVRDRAGGGVLVRLEWPHGPARTDRRA